MKATCNRDGLLTALSVVASVIPARSPKMILRHARLDATGDKVLLSGTDLELGIQYHVSGVSIHSPGVTVLPTTEVLAILRELADDTVQLESTDSGMSLSGTTGRFELNSDDPQQFPQIPDLVSSPVFKIRAAALATMIRRTTFAAAVEGSRYALHSVLLESGEKQATMVATDGKRLALMHGPCTGSTKSNASALLSPKSLILLQKVLDNLDEQVEIALSDKEAVFRTAKASIYTRLIEGKFPRYQDIVPKETRHSVPMIVNPFYSLVRQANIVTSKESKGVDFRFEKGTLVLESRSPDHGHSEVRLPIAYDKEPFQLTFDPDLFVDVLRALEPEQEVTMDVVDARKASVLRTADGYTYALMPLTRER